MLRRSFLLTAAAVLAFVPIARAQTAPADRYFDSQGVKIHYVEAGQGDPVVLVHGFSSTADANWRQPGVFDKLASEFHVIAFDCRGHGLSDKPHDVSSYGMTMVEDIARLLDHLKIARAHIVGYSMGGAITGAFVVKHPDRVLTAVFGGSAPRTGAGDQVERDANELAESLEQGKGMRPLVVRLLPTDEPRPSDEVIAQRSMAALGRNDPLALAAVTRGNKQQIVSIADVRALKMPMLAVIGSADPIKAGVDAFSKVKPELKVVVIDGATHAGARGAPSRPEFAAAVRDFLVAHRAAGTTAR
jgi:pimeloyl-ACP methyl ester carboxylesterase